jgi:cell filamentation protein
MDDYMVNPKGEVEEKMALDNKLGIRSAIELAEIEEKISKTKALELFETGKLDSFAVGKYRGLQSIHKYLFEDVYEFAGKTRDVNISKAHFRFAPVIYLNEALIGIDNMPQNNFDEIVEKYVEMNIAHPFREGNGRSMRIWLDAMLKKEIKLVIDWSKVNKKDYLMAMERSPIKDLEIKMILKNALTDKIHDREVYMKGIDASYEYEGYSTYSMEELAIDNIKESRSSNDRRKLENVKKGYK